MPKFVEFSREDSRHNPDDPMFTLQRRGLISLNLAAFNALGEPAAVALLFDADEGIVALRKVNRTYANGYHVRKQANSRSFLVGAQGFTSYHKIQTDLPKRFVGQKYDDHTWGFVLRDGIEVKSRSRVSPEADVVRPLRSGSQAQGAS
jgi:hypothetical protein